MEAPPTILSYLEENDFSGNPRPEETSEAAKFKEQGTASGFAGFGGWSNLHSLVLSLSFPCVCKATVIFWVQPGKENPTSLNILCARKELAHQTFGL